MENKQSLEEVLNLLPSMISIPLKYPVKKGFPMISRRGLVIRKLKNRWCVYYGFAHGFSSGVDHLRALKFEDESLKNAALNIYQALLRENILNSEQQ